MADKAQADTETLAKLVAINGANIVSLTKDLGGKAGRQELAEARSVADKAEATATGLAEGVAIDAIKRQATSAVSDATDAIFKDSERLSPMLAPLVKEELESDWVKEALADGVEKVAPDVIKELSPNILGRSYITIREPHGINSYEHGTNRQHVIENGPIDVSGRALTFTKVRDDSVLRISYSDNFRAFRQNKVGENWHNTDAACRWEVMIGDKDGNFASCPSGELVYDKYSGSTNIHTPAQLLGFCSSIPAGETKIKVQVRVHPVEWTKGIVHFEKTACFTGWHHSTSNLEVVEISIPKARDVAQRVASESQPNSSQP